MSSGLAAKYVLKYSQVILMRVYLRRVSSANFYKYHAINNEQVEELVKASGLPLLEYDGYGEFWFESMEKLSGLATDEGYYNIMVPDEYKFTKRDTMRAMLGEVTEKYCAGERPA